MLKRFDMRKLTKGCLDAARKPMNTQNLYPIKFMGPLWIIKDVNFKPTNVKGLLYVYRERLVNCKSTILKKMSGHLSLLKCRQKKISWRSYVSFVLIDAWTSVSSTAIILIIICLLNNYLLLFLFRIAPHPPDLSIKDWNYMYGSVPQTILDNELEEIMYLHNTSVELVRHLRVMLCYFSMNI